MASLTRLLDIGIALGVLVALLNGVDFLIRPHQRQKAQSFFEDLAIWADDASPTNLATRLTEPAVQALLLMYSAVVWAILVLPFLMLLGHMLTRGGVGAGPMFFFDSAYVCIIALPLGLLLLFAFWRWPIRPLIAWALSPQDSTRVFERGFYLFWLLWIIGIVVLLPGWIGMRFTQFGVLDLKSPVWLLIPGNAILITAFCVASATILAGQLLKGRPSYSLTVFLKMFTGVIWRIVEYQKGAIAALALVASILLAVWRLLL